MSNYNTPLDEDEIADLMVDFSRAMSRDDHDEMRRIFMEVAIRLTIATSKLDIANLNIDQIKKMAYPPDPKLEFPFDPVINRLMMGKRFEAEIVARGMRLVRESKP